MSDSMLSPGIPMPVQKSSPAPAVTAVRVALLVLCAAMGAAALSGCAEVAADHDADARIAAMHAREARITDLMAQAQAAQVAGRAGEATSLYAQVLALSPNDQRAREGLRRQERDNAHARILAEAQGYAKKGQVDAALAALKLVLDEDPDDAAARQLQRDLEGWHQQPAVSPARAELAAAFAKPVSLEFRDAPLREVFEILSRSSGLNFVLDREVKADQHTTLFLRHSTVADVLSLVLASNQLERRIVDAQTVLIYPDTPAKAHDYQALVVKTIPLDNADAKAVATTLRTILKSRDLVVLEKQNALLIRDTPEAVRLAERVAKLQDVPEAEVMLEVEILEVQRSSLLNLGVQFPGQASLSPLPTTDGGTLTLADLKHLDASHVGVSIDPMTIGAQQTAGDVRLLANPRIRALNHEKAQILVGQRVPTVTTTTTSSFVSNSVSYIDVGLKLNVEPSIGGDGEVTIRLGLEVSNVTGTNKLNDGTITYELGTRSVSTLLRLHDGENQVLAGLIDDQQHHSSAGLPGLSQIPGLGRLFGGHSDDNTQSEIVLSITPRIVRPVRRIDPHEAEFDSGTEGSLRVLTSGADANPAPNGMAAPVTSTSPMPPPPGSTTQ
jgi:general secretion pathway protein D